MGMRDRLKSLKGTRKQEDWAAAVGVDQTTVSDWLSGRRRVGRVGLSRLIACYPEHKDELTALYLSEAKSDRRAKPRPLAGAGGGA